MELLYRLRLKRQDSRHGLASPLTRARLSRIKNSVLSQWGETQFRYSQSAGTPSVAQPAQDLHICAPGFGSVPLYLAQIRTRGGLAQFVRQRRSHAAVTAELKQVGTVWCPLKRCAREKKD